MKQYVGIQARLMAEYSQFQRYAELNSNFSFRVASTVMGTEVPAVYELTYRMRTFTGIQADQSPVSGDVHHFRFDLSKDYPHQQPELYAISPVWHPNVKYFDPGKGRICFNWEVLGNQTMMHILIMLSNMLSYRNYYARINEAPYPEDLEVAKWVNEIGEPRGYIETLRQYHSKASEEAETVQPAGPAGIEARLGEFLHLHLIRGETPCLVDQEDLKPEKLFNLFCTTCQQQGLKPDAKWYRLIEQEINQLINEGRIWKLY